jgi:hypothetical protein
MPEAALIPFFFLSHSEHLKVLPKQSDNILRPEAPPVSPLGDVPWSAAAPEQVEPRAENRKHKEALWLQDAQDAGQVSRPVCLPLVMKASVIKDDVEAGSGQGHTQGIGPAKADAPDPCHPGKVPGALEGKGLIVNRGHLETQSRRGYCVTPFATAEVQ